MFLDKIPQARVANVINAPYGSPAWYHEVRHLEQEANTKIFSRMAIYRDIIHLLLPIIFISAIYNVPLQTGLAYIGFILILPLTLVLIVTELDAGYHAWKHTGRFSL